jgi:hypothetical protein
MFALPAIGGGGADGSSDERPLRLEGYLAEDFRQFLRVLLPMYVLHFDLILLTRLTDSVRVPRQHKPPALSSGQWVSVLKLSTTWNFRDIRKTAIRQLDDHARDDPILRLIVSRQFKISKWLIPAVNALARRVEPINHEDIRRLEVLGDLRSTVLDLVLKIASVRERFTGLQTQAKDPWGRMIQQATDTGLSGRAMMDFTTIITEVFDCNVKGRARVHVDPTADQLGIPTAMKYESDMDSESDSESEQRSPIRSYPLLARREEDEDSD